MAILELDPTTKNQSKNLKPNSDTIVNTSGKIVVSVVTPSIDLNLTAALTNHSFRGSLI